MIDEQTLARLRNRAETSELTGDLQLLLKSFDAMRHELETAEGLWAIDRELPNQPDMFQLKFRSIHSQRPPAKAGGLQIT